MHYQNKAHSWKVGSKFNFQRLPRNSLRNTGLKHPLLLEERVNLTPSTAFYRISIDVTAFDRENSVHAGQIERTREFGSNLAGFVKITTTVQASFGLLNLLLHLYFYGS